MGVREGGGREFERGGEREFERGGEREGGGREFLLWGV